jgi:hypothetical protein
MTAQPDRPARWSCAAAAVLSAFTLTLALSATTARAEQVAGQVFDRDGLPAPELLVRLIPRVTTPALPADDPRARNAFPVSSTSTDNEGVFQFGNVAPGRYLVVAGTIRGGMTTERFTLVGGRDQILNLQIADPIVQPNGPRFRDLRVDPEDLAQLEADRARALEEGRDPRNVSARNRDILQRMDDDDDGAGPSVFIPNDVMPDNVRRADRARRGILSDDEDDNRSITGTRVRDDDDADDDDDDRGRLGRDDDDRADDDDGDRRIGIVRRPDDRDDDDNVIDSGGHDVTRGEGGPNNTGDITRGEGGPNNTGDITRGEGGPNNTRDITRSGALGGTSDISRSRGRTGGTRDLSRDDTAIGGPTDVSTSSESARDRRARAVEVDDADDVVRAPRNTPRLRTPVQSRLQRPTRASVLDRMRPAPVRSSTGNVQPQPQPASK